MNLVRKLLLFCSLHGCLVYAESDLEYIVSIGSESHSFAESQFIYNTANISNELVDDNIQRKYSRTLSLTTPTAPSAKNIKLSIEKHSYALSLSYFSISSILDETHSNLTLINPVGDTSSGSVRSTYEFNAYGYSMELLNIQRFDKGFNYGALLGLSYWQETNTVTSHLRFEQDDEQFITAINDIQHSELRQIDTEKQSGIYGYAGGFARVKYQRFLFSLLAKFNIDSKLSYQVFALEMGYRL